jgi:hypothetical protein
MTSSINAKASQEMFQFILKGKGAIQSMTKEVLKEVALRLVARSPVGNPSLWHPAYWPKGYTPGHFINNWQLSVDSPTSTQISAIEPSGIASIERMHKSIPRWPVGHIYYFTNNLPYARLLETGLHSMQCPGGMLGLTFMEFPQIVRQVEIKYSETH